MSHESSLLFEILLLLALTATGQALFERLKLPAIAGFLTAGALAGPGMLGLVGEPERVRALAEIGVVFLLFEIGLELPPERVKRLWSNALVAGGAQVGLCIALVTGGAAAFGVPVSQGIVLGGLVAMSSTALVMRLLSDRGQIDAPHGQLAVAVLLFQDLSIVPLLLAVPLLAMAAADPTVIALSIGRLIGALALAFLLVRFLVPRVLARVADMRSPDLFSMYALLIVLGSAVMAQELGLTLAVGAFLAGVAAGASPYAHQLFSEVVPLRGVLLGIFFTAVGMLFDPVILADRPLGVLAYLTFSMGIKALIVAAVCTLVLGRGLRIGVLAGVALAQTGEFSFVLAEVAREAELLDASTHQVVIAGSILSLLATPFLVRAAPTLAEGLSSLVGGAGPETLPASAEAPKHVVVLGFGPAGRTLTGLLRIMNVPYLVLDANSASVEEGRQRGEPIFFGDATRPPVLERLGVERAKLVVVVISDPRATRRIVSRVRAMAPETPILARTRYVQEVDPLASEGATGVVAEEFEGSIELVARALEFFEFPKGAIARFTEALREEGYGAIRTRPGQSLDPWLVDLLDSVETDWVEVPEDFPGSTSLVELEIRRHTGANIMAVERGTTTHPNPGPEFEIAAGDRLLVLGDAANLAALTALLRSRQEKTGSSG